MDEITCKKCGEEVVVDGEYPKFIAWCDTCNDYADCDMHNYTADWMGTRIDEAYDRVRDEKFDTM